MICNAVAVFNHALCGSCQQYMSHIVSVAVFDHVSCGSCRQFVLLSLTTLCVGLVVVFHVLLLLSSTMLHAGLVNIDIMCHLLLY